MKIIDINTWNRKEHFEFFSKYEEPYFGIVSEVECTKAFELARSEEFSFFAYYLHKSILAVNAVEAFKYRIQDGQIIVFDTIHAGATIGRDDETFGFSLTPFSADFKSFNEDLNKEIEEVKNSTGLRMDIDANRMDLIHHSTFPWSRLTGLTHPRSFNTDHSIPKITFGKAFDRDSKKILPVAVDVHHGLMDGIHVAKYLDHFQNLLNGEE